VFEWDTASAAHGALPNGIYLMSIETPGSPVRTARIALVR